MSVFNTRFIFPLIFLFSTGCEKPLVDNEKIKSVYPEGKNDYIRIANLLKNPKDFENGYVCVMEPYQARLSGKNANDGNVIYAYEKLNEFLSSDNYRVPEGNWAIFFISKNGEISKNEIDRYKTPLILFNISGRFSKNSAGQLSAECVSFEKSILGRFVEGSKAIGVSLYKVKK